MPPPETANKVPRPTRGSLPPHNVMQDCCAPPVSVMARTTQFQFLTYCLPAHELNCTVALCLDDPSYKGT